MNCGFLENSMEYFFQFVILVFWVWFSGVADVWRLAFEIID
jgi:hypothetical protein